MINVRTSLEESLDLLKAPGTRLVHKLRRSSLSPCNARCRRLRFGYDAQAFCQGDHCDCCQSKCSTAKRRERVQKHCRPWTPTNQDQCVWLGCTIVRAHEEEDAGEQLRHVGPLARRASIRRTPERPSIVRRSARGGGAIRLALLWPLGRRKKEYQATPNFTLNDRAERPSHMDGLAPIVS